MEEERNYKKGESKKEVRREKKKVRKAKEGEIKKSKE
jgi:hypothetical protein